MEQTTTIIRDSSTQMEVKREFFGCALDEQILDQINRLKGKPPIALSLIFKYCHPYTLFNFLETIVRDTLNVKSVKLNPRTDIGRDLLCNIVRLFGTSTCKVTLEVEDHCSFLCEVRSDSHACFYCKITNNEQVLTIREYNKYLHADLIKTMSKLPTKTVKIRVPKWSEVYHESVFKPLALNQAAETIEATFHLIDSSYLLQAALEEARAVFPLTTANKISFIPRYNIDSAHFELNNYNKSKKSRVLILRKSPQLARTPDELIDLVLCFIPNFFN